jgi:Fe-S-cluster containining protein
MGSNQKGFVCRRCGNCCKVPGYVYLTDEDVDAIATFLGMDVATFTDQYTRLTPQRRGLSLIEMEDGSCVFLDNGRDCRIEAAKPLQCRQFPFAWRYEKVQEICKGWQEYEDCDS